MTEFNGWWTPPPLSVHLVGGQTSVHQPGNKHLPMDIGQTLCEVRESGLQAT